MDCSKDSPTEPSLSSPGEDIDTVESLIKRLYIEKGRRRLHRVSQNNKNPFKRKFLKKQKRKLSICYSSAQCKEILDKLGTAPKDSKKEKESNNVMLKITEKMAKMWNDDGYREILPAQLRSTKISSNALKNENASTASSTTTNSEENSENHLQVSSQTCARQAMYDYCDSSLSSVTELAAYLDEALFIPRKMSFMAQNIYS